MGESTVRQTRQRDIEEGVEKALKGNWAGKTTIATNSSQEETVDTQAILSYWYTLEYLKGVLHQQKNP